VLVGYAESDLLLPELNNMKIPGNYWMEGGVYESISMGCFDMGEGGKECPFSTTVKAEGKFYDTCYEMAKGLGIDIETHCDLIQTRLECARVNTCQWTDANICEYTAEKRTIGAKSSKRHL
jgi:hypothetical protein